MGNNIVQFLILIITIWIQTVFFKNFYITPDIALIILIFFSIKYGRMTGQLFGFFSGLFMDFLSTSPLGFHALLYTIIGYLFGFLKGNVIIDVFFIPPAILFAATLLKYLLIFFMFNIFLKSFSILEIFTLKFVYEIFLNMIFTMLVFYIFNKIKFLKMSANRY